MLAILDLIYAVIVLCIFLITHYVFGQGWLATTCITIGAAFVIAVIFISWVLYQVDKATPNLDEFND